MKFSKQNKISTSFKSFRKFLQVKSEKLSVLNLKPKQYYPLFMILFFGMGALVSYVLNNQLSNENLDTRSRAASNDSIIKSRISGSIATAVVSTADDSETVYINRDIYAINRNGASGKTEVHQLSASSNFQEFRLQTSTALGPTNSLQWSFAYGFFDNDHFIDIYAINRNGASGKTEINILTGASNFSQFALKTATALETSTGDKWVFLGGNFDGDGKTDLYAVNKQGGSGKTEVHVLSGKSDFKEFALHGVTGLHSTDKNWSFYAAGSKGGGGIDTAYDSLIAINRRGASGKSELHALNARSNFSEFNYQGVLPLEPTDNSNWVFAGGAFDGNRDFFTDIYAINRRGSSGKTEVHVTTDADRFEKFYMETATVLPSAGNEWSFANAQDFPESTPNPTATIAATRAPTNPPNITVTPTNAPVVTQRPTNNPTQPVPTYVCGGSPNSICSTPTPTPQGGLSTPAPTVVHPTQVITQAPIITPPVNQDSQDDCLDTRSTPERINAWVQGFLKKIGDYIQRVMGNPQDTTPPPTPCIRQ